MTSRPAREAVVRLHLLPFPSDGAESARLKDLLAEDELLRAERLIEEKRRERFVAGRGMLREILAEYLETDARKVTLTAGANGKPCLDEAVHGQAVRFNLSHSGDLLLLAVTLENEVGIDLEQVAPDLAYAAMAKRYFSPCERSGLAALPEHERREAFYRLWTRKEAYIKGIGAGFGKRSDGFDVTLSPDRPEIVSDRCDPEEAQKWCLVDLTVGAGYLASLAFRGPIPELEWVTSSWARSS